MRIVPVPCLSDNYAYLVINERSAEAIVVDPSEAQPVLDAVERNGVHLAAIVNTHHHPDHVDGNLELCRQSGGLPVYAHRSDIDRVPGLSNPIDQGGDFEIAGLRLSPLHVPGHTLGAVAYVVDGAVFTGDTLFVGGCGRLFEGTAPQMYASLNDKLARLPPATRVYPGHEYTESNLRFAVDAEPDNRAAQEKLAWAKAVRDYGDATVPSTMGEELEYNPFLRCGSKAIRARFAGAGPVEVFAALRHAKDSFH